jgi:hypothetical protein
MDGTTALTLFGGGVPPGGSTEQVGALNGNTLLVTLKTDPIPGTVRTSFGPCSQCSIKFDAKDKCDLFIWNSLIE